LDLNLTELREFGLSIVYGYPEIAGGLALFCVVLAWFSLLRTGVKKMVTSGQKRMSVQQREIVEDAITDALEEAVHSGTMSRKSARYWYGTLAQDYGLNGLVIRNKMLKKLHRFKAERLKEEIKARLANGIYKTECKLPVDNTPPWETNNGRMSTQDKFRAKFLKTA
jgi:hypothetical protein